MRKDYQFAWSYNPRLKKQEEVEIVLMPDNVWYYKDTHKTVFGYGLDVDKALQKLPKPKGGFTLPGHRYTGPYNALEHHLKYDPKTGKILEIYDQPIRPTDAIAIIVFVKMIENTNIKLTGKWFKP